MTVVYMLVEVYVIVCTPPGRVFVSVIGQREVTVVVTPSMTFVV
jgi:hypothetical protein